MDEDVIKSELANWYRRGIETGSFLVFFSLYDAVMLFYDIGLLSDDLCKFADRFFMMARDMYPRHGFCMDCPSWHPDAHACMMDSVERFHACPLYDGFLG